MQTVSSNDEQKMVINQAKSSLVDFAIAIDPKYQDTWFHETVSNILQTALERVEEGKDVRIILQCPPRHGKSYTSTQLFSAWALGHHPDWPIAVASYSGDLATKFGQQTRDIMQSGRYQKIFDTRLNPDSKAKGYWKTKEGGSYMAAGAGGAFTGTGFKIGIIDDIFKNREEAESEVIRESRWDWYRSTFYTRQESNTAIIVINTRWHTDDLVGRLLAKEESDRLNEVEDYDEWIVINFPAIASEDEQYRKQGEALWPQKFPLTKLRKTENTLGPYEFAALYQGSPITSENQEFKEAWLKTRTWQEVDALNTRKFATIDPGGKEVENDYTGIIRNYVDQQNNWNLRAMRIHFGSDELINYIFRLHDEGFEKIGVEETVYLRAIEPFFKQECRKRNKFPNIEPLKHSGRNKEVRIRGLIPRYSSGSIYHVEGECKDLTDEMMVFPKGAHDDVLDALAYQNDIAESPIDTYKQAIIRHQREQRKEGLKKNYGL